MNFDGHADIRLVESRAAGPTLPCLHWLYEPASGRFVASPALNDLGGQAARQTVNGFCAKKAVAGPNTNRLGDWLAGSAARMRE